MKNQLRIIHQEILDTYDLEGGINHVDESNLPSKREVDDIINKLMPLLFPGFFNPERLDRYNLEHWSGHLLDLLYQRMLVQVTRSICFVNTATPHSQHMSEAQRVTLEVLAEIPKIRRLLKLDVHAAYMGDPAANSHEEVIMSYPSVKAIALYRFAHELYLRDVPFIPRMITEHAKEKTGIDIHPGARIGESFFIDHGTGVVVGETCEIGVGVKIYQMVTLGAMSFQKNEKGEIIKGLKRHPTIEDHVILYAGCSILGGETVIGANSVIGGNVWINNSVPANTVITFDVKKQEYRQYLNSDSSGET